LERVALVTTAALVFAPWWMALTAGR
jgi:hypothetical protein